MTRGDRLFRAVLLVLAAEIVVLGIVMLPGDGQPGYHLTLSFAVGALPLALGALAAGTRPGRSAAG